MEQFNSGSKKWGVRSIDHCPVEWYLRTAVMGVSAVDQDVASESLIGAANLSKVKRVVVLADGTARLVSSSLPDKNRFSPHAR
jgi:hypothetical protein